MPAGSGEPLFANRPSCAAHAWPGPHVGSPPKWTSQIGWHVLAMQTVPFTQSS